MSLNATNVCLIALWIVVFLRFPAGRDRAAVFMWSAIVCGLLGVSTGEPQLHAWSVRQLGTGTVLTIQSVSISISMIFLISLVRDLSGKPVLRPILAIFYLLVLTLVLVPIVTGTRWTSSLEFEDALLTAGPAAPVWTTHRLAMYALDMAATIYAAYFCKRYSKVSDGPLSSGLKLIGIGCAMAFAYAAASSGLIIAVTMDWATVTAISIRPVLYLLALGSMVATCAGYAIEPSVRTLAAAKAWHDLRLLWNDLAKVMPFIVFPESRWTVGGRFGVRLQDRLYRRVMEIKDGILTLRENLPAGFLDRSARDAVTTRSCVERAQTLAEAHWIRQAIVNRQTQIRYASSAAPLNRPGLSFSEEVAWLRCLAVNYRYLRMRDMADVDV